MKAHYKGTFNAAQLLKKNNPKWDAEEDEDEDK